MKQFALFTSGLNGYHTYRIPALVTAGQNTLLAFCEGRKYDEGDAGQIDILLKRSSDDGHTWSEAKVIITDGEMTCGNPCPMFDGTTGTIWLSFCKNQGDGPEGKIIEGKAPRTVWLTWSVDYGASWHPPVEITPQVKDPAWTWYATGPGHGIQLPSGRLVIPCDHIVGVNLRANDPYHSHVIYSDDHGVTWHIGGIADEGTNESCIAETSSGLLYLNCRSARGAGKRAVTWSRDGGQTFLPISWDEALPEPRGWGGCQGSLVRIDIPPPNQGMGMLFANPAGATRERMTIRLSCDEGRSWPISRMLYVGPSAYSDLAILPGNKIYCLYERGDKHPYETLTLAQFNLEWLKEM